MRALLRAAGRAVLDLGVLIPAALVWGLYERARGREPQGFEDIEPDGRPVIRAVEDSRRKGNWTGET